MTLARITTLHLAMARELVAVLVVALASLWTSPAWAQRVVIVRPLDPDARMLEAFNRLRGELMIHGFDVTLTALDNQASPAELAKIAEKHTAVASVSFERALGSASADIWISDRVTGKTTIRTISTGNDEDSPSLLAIRAVELLRASLREFPQTAAPPKDIVGATPERAPQTVLRWAQEPSQADTHRSRWWLHAGAAFFLPIPLRAAAGGPAFGLGYWPHDRWSLKLGAASPLTGIEVRAEEASATLHFLALGADASYRFRLGETFELDGGATAGSLYVTASGGSDGRWLGVTARRWLLSAGVTAGLVWKVTGNVGLRLDVRGSWCVPRPIVSVATERFVLGRPAVLGGLGVVAAL